MGEVRCEICGRPALYHETVITAGHATTIHRCAQHGAAVWEKAVADARACCEKHLDPMIERLWKILMRDLGRDTGRRDA